ncbi:MAG: hypothetical protein AAFX62_17490 [Pseudomonadota bacterium]
MPPFEPPNYPEDLKSLEVDKRSEKWARAALESECARVARAIEGTRNQILKTAAFNLGRKVGGGYLSAQEVEDRLMAAAEECG